MGAWGTSLYANDSASDIRGTYEDGLRKGKTNEEITQKILHDNRSIIGDVEEEPLLWFSLADCQWNYGRLMSEVKEKALYFLDRKEELERWRESGERQLLAWQRTLENLRSKLNSPQPAEKKVRKYKLYTCPWKLGDVFAYRFTSDYSKEKGFYGKYCAFRKISQNNIHPGNIVPVVKFYFWIGEDLPKEEELKTFNYLPQLLFVSEFPIFYATEISIDSEKKIPTENLIYLCNIDGDDIDYNGEIEWSVVHGKTYVGWEASKCNNKIEHCIIQRYLEWSTPEGLARFEQELKETDEQRKARIVALKEKNLQEMLNRRKNRQ